MLIGFLRRDSVVATGILRNGLELDKGQVEAQYHAFAGQNAIESYKLPQDGNTVGKYTRISKAFEAL